MESRNDLVVCVVESAHLFNQDAKINLAAMRGSRKAGWKVSQQSCHSLCSVSHFHAIQIANGSDKH